ncbi:unnamed protein product [Rotaria socialis]|uniref:Uncharacterized protein n=1 Tax=Rotaria socialis TaxID=392032 RepID=A0A818FBD2_9BILA|nr:unnamed protein product [Rotaria socialis]
MGREECHTNLDEYQLKDQNLNAVLPTTSDRLPTLSEIKVKLPEYCFRPSFRQSIAYVIKDIFFVIFAVVLIDVPWFVDLEWNYVKGQLSTVDRHYGHIHSLIHSIGTHQIHHLFAKIPHYHLETATMHFRKAFSDLVRVKHNTILPSFIRMFKLFLRQRTIGQDVYIFAYVND